MTEAVSLEQQIEVLRRQVAERDAIIAAGEAERADAALLKARLTTALLEIERIKLQLAVLKRQRYGQSSERLDRDIDQLEMQLEDLETDCGEQFAASAGSADPPDPQSRRPSSNRKPLPAHLPREVVVHEPEITCVCGGCDPARLARLGEATTEVLEKIPARLKVIQHVRPKYACRVCERIYQAPASALPIEQGRPGKELLAHVAVLNTATGSRSTGSPASWSARASRSIARPWRSGLGTWPGGCVRWPS